MEQMGSTNLVPVALAVPDEDDAFGPYGLRIRLTYGVRVGHGALLPLAIAAQQQMRHHGAAQPHLWMRAAWGEWVRG